jgi:ABC-type uncharacterized transport system ATPase subunit
LNKPAVEFHNISKSFGSIKANDSISFSIRKGSIHAIVGENGAGKTTLMKILYGMYHSDSGEILINGTMQAIDSPARAIQLGIGMVHQHFMLVKPMTVLENIILGLEPDRKFAFIDYDRARNRIQNLIASFKFKTALNEKVENLSVSTEQQVEILKILYRNAGILILDEPTAVLAPQECNDLFAILKELRDEGKTIILITHKLSEVMRISDHVTVLRHGRVTGDIETNNTSVEELAELIVRKMSKSPLTTGDLGGYVKEDDVLSVSNLTVLNDRRLVAINDVSLTLHSGEILGIAGIEGSGQNEFAEAIAGIREFESGTIVFFPFVGGSAGDVAHIPGNRQEHGLVLEMSVKDNMILGRQRESKFVQHLVGRTFLSGINEDSVRKFADDLIAEYNIRPPDPLRKVRFISGGNQQKIILARELSKDAHVIILNQPTRGLDINASEFVRKTIIEQKHRGRGIILISHDLSELLKLSDRIAVFYDGRIVKVLSAPETNEYEIGKYMTGLQSIPA